MYMGCMLIVCDYYRLNMMNMRFGLSLVEGIRERQGCGSRIGILPTFKFAARTVGY